MDLKTSKNINSSNQAGNITSEKQMSDRVKNAILSGTIKLESGYRLKCDIAIREFSFKNCIFDVVGYNKQENITYIFECKLGTNITSIAQAFGQILGYKAILKESGRDFLSRFYQKYHEDIIKNRSLLRINLEDWIEIVSSQKMNFMFFVVFREGARNLQN